MAFELPTLPFPKDSTGTPYIASPDANGKYTVASGQWFKNASNILILMAFCMQHLILKN